MHPVFNAFKRHYRKAKDVFAPMVETGSFGYNAHYTRGAGMSAAVVTPDAELTVRFVVLVRRFLDPADPFYYETVWKSLDSEFGAEIPNEAREAYQQFAATLQGDAGMKIVFNGEDLTPARIYQMLAEGEYFNRDERTRALLTSIAQIPLAGPLFWFQFYDYSTGGLYMASLLFDIIRQVEQTGAYRNRYSDPEEATHRCIFCLTATGQFTSEEHIIPEALANAEWILPKGYVCDACNNGVLASVDNALALSPLFAYQRVHYLPYDKKGRLPEARLGQTTLKRTGPLNIHMRADPGSNAIKREEELGDGWVRFTLHGTSNTAFDERILARALCKVALELVAADHGQEYACSGRFDAVRKFITTPGSDFRNNLGMRTEFTPEPRIHVFFPSVAEGTLVELHIYGVVFILNLEEHPVLELNDAAREMGLIAFPLHGEANWESFHLQMVQDPALLEAIPEQYRPKVPASPLIEPAQQPTAELPSDEPLRE